MKPTIFGPIEVQYSKTRTTNIIELRCPHTDIVIELVKAKANVNTKDRVRVR